MNKIRFFTIFLTGVLCLILFSGAAGAATQIITDGTFTQPESTSKWSIGEVIGGSYDYASASIQTGSSHGCVLNYESRHRSGAGHDTYAYAAQNIPAVSGGATLDDAQTYITITLHYTSLSGYSSGSNIPVVHVAIDDTELLFGADESAGIPARSLSTTATSYSLPIPSRLLTSSNHRLVIFAGATSSSTDDYMGTIIIDSVSIYKNGPVDLTSATPSPASGTVVKGFPMSLTVYWDTSGFSSGTNTVTVYWIENNAYDTFTITSSSVTSHTFTHTYSSAGTYGIYVQSKLSRTGKQDITDSLNVGNYVVLAASPISVTSATFSPVSGSATTGQTNTITVNYNTGSYFSTSNTNKIFIDWGDSTTISQILVTSASSTSGTQTHNYANSGTYTVEITPGVYTDNAWTYGTSKSYQYTVNVGAPTGSIRFIQYVSGLPQEISSVTQNTQFYIDFSNINWASGAASYSLSLSMDNGATTIQTWTGSNIPANYLYAGYSTTGTKTVKVTATNGGQSAVFTKNIVISATPVPTINSLTITSGSSTGAAPFSVVLYPQINWGSGGSGASIVWTFTETTTSVSTTETQTSNIDSGYQHTFSAAGTYSVSIVATSNYGTQSSSYTMATQIVVSEPIVTPTSIIGGGSGSMYASTFVTIYVLSDPYGTPLSGIHVSAVGYTASAASWLGDLFGQTWGDRVQGSEVADNTDFEGKVTFPMFPSVKYTVTITDSQNRMQSQPYTYSFTPSTLTTPYQIYIQIVSDSERYSQNDVVTSVVVNNSDGTFTADYIDNSGTTTGAAFTVYLKNNEDEWESQQYLSAIIGSNHNWNTNKTISGFSGHEYKFVFTAESEAFGHLERIFYKTFSGPRLDIGIPSSLYIWICFLTALILGGVATYLSSPATCFLICFVEWIYWFFGWFYEIDEIVPGISISLLIMATILSIAYYISSRK